MIRKYVFVSNHEDIVRCPFCGYVMSFDAQGDIKIPCEHLDHEDYLSPTNGGVDVWFHKVFTVPQKEVIDLGEYGDFLPEKIEVDRYNLLLSSLGIYDETEYIVEVYSFTVKGFLTAPDRTTKEAELWVELSEPAIINEDDIDTLLEQPWASYSIATRNIACAGANTKYQRKGKEVAL